MADRINKRQFKLATTSFIVPDYIVPNVEKLGPYMDEIELLVFESRPQKVIPSPQEVKRLLELAQEHNHSYNVHLPVDINPADPDKQKRQKACDTLMVVFERFERLAVSTHTLHLPMPEKIRTGRLKHDAVKQWQQDATSGIECLLERGIDPGKISIETLDYPFEYLEPVVSQCNLTICADLGHLIKYDFDYQKLFHVQASNIPLIHLHGVDLEKPRKKDHQSVDRLPTAHLDRVIDLLCRFTGVVSIEVFNLGHLQRSLALLSKRFAPMPGKFVEI